MELLKAVLLGLVQGFSEFLPISSSGHLVLASEILNFHEEGIAFEVFLHFGTLLSVLVAFRKEIGKMIIAPYLVWIKKTTDEEIQEFLRWDWYVILATIPAAVVGLTFKDELEALFSSVLLVVVLLMITGLIMWSSKFMREKGTVLTGGNTFLIGLAQAFAILPGISRSGSTIVSGLAMGINRETVAKFSFIMSLPAIAGAFILKFKDLMAVPPAADQILNLVIGTIVSAVSGYIAILWLLDVVKKGKLEWFGYYCMAVSVSGFIWYVFQ